MDKNKINKQFINELKQQIKNESLESILKIKNLSDYPINKKDKGFIGNFIQEVVFDINRNSSKSPDFENQSIELKVTPMKIKDDGNYTSKERLVCNLINFHQIIMESNFYQSSFYQKNAKLLIFFYLHIDDYLNQDKWKKIKILEIDLFNLLELDEIKQIQEDYYFIVNKIKQGLAHEISGSDTQILEACTKGSSSSDLTTQPFNEIKAKKRAFAFKSKFVTKLFFRALNGSDLKEELDTPIKLMQLILKYKNNSIDQLQKTFKFDTKSKSFRIWMLLKIFGVDKITKIPALFNYDLSLKTIVLENNGKLVESIPLLKINPVDLQNEFEDSEFYDVINKPFLFVIFKKQNKNKFDDLISDCFLLDLSIHKDILENAKQVYNHTRNLFLNGGILEKVNKKDKYNFIKLIDDKDFHIRPKARDKTDRYTTNYGENITKQGFWLNNKTFIKLYKEFKNKNKQ